MLNPMNSNRYDEDRRPVCHDCDRDLSNDEWERYEEAVDREGEEAGFPVCDPCTGVEEVEAA